MERSRRRGKPVPLLHAALHARSRLDVIKTKPGAGPPSRRLINCFVRDTSLFKRNFPPYLFLQRYSCPPFSDRSDLVSRIQRGKKTFKIAGGGEQHAGALQVSRHVRLLRAQDLLEGGAGLPTGRENVKGSFPKRRVSGTEQSRQRNAADTSEGFAKKKAGSTEAKETSRWRTKETASGSR